MRLWLLPVIAGYTCWLAAITAGMLSVSRASQALGGLSLSGSDFTVTGSYGQSL